MYVYVCVCERERKRGVEERKGRGGLKGDEEREKRSHRRQRYC